MQSSRSVFPKRSCYCLAPNGSSLCAGNPLYLISGHRLFVLCTYYTTFFDFVKPFFEFLCKFFTFFKGGESVLLKVRLFSTFTVIAKMSRLFYHFFCKNQKCNKRGSGLEIIYCLDFIVQFDFCFS